MTKQILGLVAALGMSASLAVPAFAADKAPVHLDVTTGVVTESNLTKNQTNIEFASARLSKDILKGRVTVFAQGSANEVNRSNTFAAPSLNFSASTLAYGARLNVSKVTNVTVATGTAINDQLVSASPDRVNKFTSLSVSTRVF